MGRQEQPARLGRWSFKIFVTMTPSVALFKKKKSTWSSWDEAAYPTIVKYLHPLRKFQIYNVTM